MSTLKLEIRRSAYYIYGYEPGLSSTLERSLAVYDFISKKYTHWAFIYDEDSKILKIPGGIDLQFILDKLCSDGIVITDIENNFDSFVESRRINKIESKVTPRDKHQKDAITFVVAADASDKHRSHRLLSLDTGFGKTVCAIHSALILKMPTVVTSVNLSQQWLDRILSFTNGKLGIDVFYLKTWDEITRLINDKHPKMGSFYIIGLDALNAGLRNDPEILNKFYEKFGIGLQIFDEVHEHFIKIINVLVHSSVERVLYLSATPARSDKSQDALYRKIFRDNVPSYGEHTHTINKFNIISFKYKTKPSFGDMFRVQPRRGVSAVGYFNYMLKHETRVKIIINSVRFFTNRIFKMYGYNADKKVLVYVQSLEIIKIVKKSLEMCEPLPTNFKPSVGDYTGNIDKKVRHLELNNNIILTTIANRAGLDIDGLIMILNFTPMSSDGMIKQIRGRLRDRDAFYVDCCDTGFDGMLRQYDKRMINHKRCARTVVHYEYTDNGIVKCNG